MKEKVLERDKPITRLIQHDYARDPFKILVCCLLLNRTGGKQVRAVLKEFFSKWPHASSLLKADDAELIRVITPLGFYNRRAKLLKVFAKDYLEKKWEDPRELHGIGEYGWEAWQIIVLHKTDFVPTDSILRRYLDWLNQRDGQPGTGSPQVPPAS